MDRHSGRPRIVRGTRDLVPEIGRLAHRLDPQLPPQALTQPEVAPTGFRAPPGRVLETHRFSMDVLAERVHAKKAICER